MIKIALGEKCPRSTSDPEVAASFLAISMPSAVLARGTGQQINDVNVPAKVNGYSKGSGRAVKALDTSGFTFESTPSMCRA